MIQKIKYDLIRNQLETGDMVFFSGSGFVSETIKRATGSEWSHVGLVIKIDILDLVLIWESTTLSNVHDLATGQPIKGVQIVPLSQRIAKYQGYYGFRRMGIPSKYVHYESALKRLRRELDGKPYEEDKIQLAKSALNLPEWLDHDSDLSSIFCSELVAEYYLRLGLLPHSKPSCAYSPAELAVYDYF